MCKIASSVLEGSKRTVRFVMSVRCAPVVSAGKQWRILAAAFGAESADIKDPCRSLGACTAVALVVSHPVEAW